MTKAEAWDIVSGIVEDIDTEDMTQLIEHLDSLLRKQDNEENRYKNDHWLEVDAAKKLNKAAAERQVIATWYKPEEKLPPADCNTVITFSGKLKNTIYDHALGIASYFPGEGWGIDGMDENVSDRMTIEAWADLEAYGTRAVRKYRTVTRRPSRRSTTSWPSRSTGLRASH